MTAIRITAFAGEQPKIIPRLLPPNGAQAAFNARLDDGALTPLRQSALEEVLPDANRITIYKHGTDWLSWDVVVNAAPGPVAADRLYFTGDGVPKMLVASTEYPLALAPPAAALTATVGGAGAGDVVTRVYVYTWVTDFGEESEPSPASAPVDWMPGQTMTLSGFAATPSGRNITKQRIYRSQTGQSGTYLYLIDERTAAATDYVDAVAVDALQEALPSADWNAPVDGLTGLTAMPNGMMAAFEGKTLYFCEPFRPHAWPQKYTLTTDFDIVALGAIGTSLVVLTTGNPYFASGSSPAVMTMVKLEQNFPCINASGVVDMGYAICFPTDEGLAAVRGDGSIGLVSATLFGRYEWKALDPDTIVAAQYGGRYVAFYDTVNADGDDVVGGMFIAVGENPFLGRTRVQAQAAFFDITESALYYVPTGGEAIYRYDAPGAVRDTIYWKSKEFWSNTPTNYGALRVDADGTLSPEEAANLAVLIAAITAANQLLLDNDEVISDINSMELNVTPLAGDNLTPIPSGLGEVQVGIWANRVKVASISVSNRDVRLPAGFTAELWEIDVSTDARVMNITMGETMDDLRQVPA